MYKCRKGMEIRLFFFHLCMQSQKFDCPISLLAKENSKAKELFADDAHFNEIIILEKDMDGLRGMLNLINENKKEILTKFLFSIPL